MQEPHNISVSPSQTTSNLSRPGTICQDASSPLSPVSRSQVDLELSSDGKTCFDCKCYRPLQFFSQRNVKGSLYRDYRCNKCRAKRESLSVRVTERKLAFDAARSKPCSDCGNSFPAVCMCFDRIAGTQTFDMGSSWRWAKQKTLDIEMANHHVVCYNCKQIRTLLRKDNKPVDLAKFAPAPRKVAKHKT
jgi:hypothetical protein